MPIDKEALEYLVGLGNPDIVNVDGRSYSPLFRLHPVSEPSPALLRVHTLQGLVDFIGTEDFNDLGDKINDPFIQVASPTEVNFYSTLQSLWLDRHIYCEAEIFKGDGFVFGAWHSHEDFMIDLQSKFVQDETTAEILRIIGNIVDENVKTIVDDGTGQKVMTRTELRPQEERIPSPVDLRPFCTFPEVEQPARRIVTRTRKGKELPEMAFFDADNGQWRLKAVQSIKAWLQEKLPDMIIIA